MHSRRGARSSRLFQVVALTCTAGTALGQHADFGGVGGHRPIALHQLVVVPPAGDAVIPLRGYDLDGDNLKATVKTLPENPGSVYQLSKVSDIAPI